MAARPGADVGREGFGEILRALGDRSDREARESVACEGVGRDPQHGGLRLSFDRAATHYKPLLVDNTGRVIMYEPLARGRFQPPIA